MRKGKEKKMKSEARRFMAAALSALLVLTSCPAPSFAGTNESEANRMENILHGPRKAPQNDAASSDAGTTEQGYVTEIKSAQILLARGASKQSDGTYKWIPLTNAADHRFTYKLHFETGGVGDLTGVIGKDKDGRIVPGDFSMTIPKHLIHNREQINNSNATDYDDYVELAVPSYDDVKDKDEAYFKEHELSYVYYDDGNNYVITNVIPVPAGTNGDIEVAYITKDTTDVYKDMTSFQLTGSITVREQNGPHTQPLTESPVAYIDTTATIKSTSKAAPYRATRSWQSAWGIEPNEYKNADGTEKNVYIVWTVKSDVGKDPTQPYTFSIEDLDSSIEVTAYGMNEDGNNIGKVTVKEKPKVILINVNNKWETPENGKVTTTNPDTVDGYRYDYVVTAMPAEEYNNYYSYAITNRLTASVHPYDDQDGDSSATASSTFVWEQPRFIYPTGHFYAYKFGDYDSHTKPYYYYHDDHDYSWYSLDRIEWDETHSNDVVDSEKLNTAGGNDDDSFFWFDLWGYGYAYPWSVPEGASYKEPENYGLVPITWTLTDDSMYLDDRIGEADDKPVLPENPNILDEGDYNIKEIPVEVTGWAADTFDPSDLDSNGSFGTHTLGNDTYPFVKNPQNKDSDGKVIIDNNHALVNVYAKFGKRSNDYTYVGYYDLTSKGPEGVVADGYTDKLQIIQRDAVFYWNKEKQYCDFKVKFLTDDVVGFKLEMTNNWYYDSIHAYPHVALKRNEHVLDYLRVKDSDNNFVTWKNRLLLGNMSNFVVTKTKTYENGSTEGEPYEIFEMPRMTLDRAVRPAYSNELRKHVISTGSDKTNKTAIVRWKVDEREEVATGDGESGMVLQDSGVFYDLLPEGSTFDPSSLTVKAASSSASYVKNAAGKLTSKVDYGTTLSEDMYTYTLQDNYNKSNRTLLTVKITKPAYAYSVWYNTVHSWDSIKDYGTDILNPVAYETGNEIMHGGYKDDGGAAIKDDNFTDNDNDALSDKNKEVMKGLDPAYTGSYTKFLFSEEPHNIDTTTWSVSGLKKQVKSSEDKIFSYSSWTEPDDYYTYNIRFENTALTKSKDIILYDNLEQYTSTTENVAGSNWLGTLVGIGLTQPMSIGAAPKAYIRTTPLDTMGITGDKPDELNLTEANGWTLLTDTSSQSALNTAKAVAIDLKETSGGNDFILDAGKSITVKLYMKAPSKPNNTTVHPIPENEYPYAYNNIYASDKTTDAMTNTAVWPEESSYIHQDYTKLALVVRGDVPLHKVSEKDTTRAVEGAVFTLTGTSAYGTKVNETATTSEDGNIIFKNIEKGSYDLVETGATDDWFVDGIIHKVVIDDNGDVYIDRDTASGTNTTAVTRDNPAVFTDMPRIHADLSFKKKCTTAKGTNDGTGIQASAHSTSTTGAEFKLSGTSDYGNSILMQGTADENGMVSFSNIEKGRYTLKETKPADGFDINTDTWTVIIDENGYIGITTADGRPVDMESNGTKVIYNTPKWDFWIWKNSSYNKSESVSGVVFKLSGISNKGETVNVTSDPTGTDGGMQFTEIPAGTYTFEEAVAPNGYTLDTTKRTLTVTEDGIVTISGITPWAAVNGDSTDYSMHIINQKIPTDQIVVIKKWVDDDPSTRTMPTFYITAQKPKEAGNEATFGVDNNERTGKQLLKGLPHLSSGGYIDRYESGDSNTEETRATTYVYAYPISFQKGDNALTLDEVKARPDATRADDGTTNYQIWIYSDRDTSVKHKVGVNTISTSSEIYEGINYYWWSNAQTVYLPEDSSYIFSYFFSYDAKYHRPIVQKMKCDLSEISMSKVKNMSNMFTSCFQLNTIKGLCTTNNLNNTSSMFSGCSGLTSLDLSSFNTGNVTDMSYMFQNCESLTSLDLSSFNTGNVTDMSYMFQNCKSLTSIDVPNFDTASVTNMQSMFEDCMGLTSLDVSNFDTANVTYMSAMFYGCSGLKTLDLSSFNTKKVTNMGRMFYDCSGLITLDLSSFNTKKVTNMGNMFSGCSGLTTIYAGDKWNTDQVTYSTKMFKDCTSLKGGNGTTYSSDKPLDKTYARIDTADTPGYFTRKTA